MKRHHCPFIISSGSRFPVLFVVIVSLAVGAYAQRATGTISGHAVDKQGALLPGARVRLQPGDITGARDSKGEFTLIGVTAGDYTLTVSYVGFSDFTQRINVTAGQVIRVEAKMEVSAKGEVVTVIADVQGVDESINEQRTSDNILDVMPEGVIQSLPSENIADPYYYAASVLNTSMAMANPPRRRLISSGNR